MPVPALSHWPWLRRWFGNRSERAAERFLKRKGYRILRRNYSCPGGELDLVALDGRCIIFAEVRSTAQADSERPAQSIDLEKQRRMTRAAVHFIRRHRLREPECRYDILILCWPPDQSQPRIEHYPNAFEAVGRFQMDY
jgi:putative endonuclease